MAVNGYAITTAGSELLSYLLANGLGLTLTRVQFGTGIHSGTTPADLVDRTSLITALGNGTLGAPFFANGRLFINVAYDNSLNGGLLTNAELSEFGIFATDPRDSSECLLIYGSMGANPEILLAYSQTCVMVRKYQVAVQIGSVSGTTANFGSITGYVVSASAPADTALIWVDSAHNNVLKIYDGSNWVATAAVLPVVSVDPANPMAGQIWLNTGA